MVNITPAGENAYFYQWDANATLIVSGCKEVHFCHDGDEKAIVVNVQYPKRCHCDPPRHGHLGRRGFVIVPASLLETDETLIAYGYDCSNTMARFEFDVRHRPRPSHYVAPSEVPKWQELLDKIKRKLNSPFANGSKNDILVNNGYGGTKWVPPSEVISAATDYNPLSNKPSIEGHELIGNKTFEELGLESITTQEIDEIFEV